MNFTHQPQLAQQKVSQATISYGAIAVEPAINQNFAVVKPLEED